jgi:spermidine/putrescine-binding protein
MSRSKRLMSGILSATILLSAALAGCSAKKTEAPAETGSNQTKLAKELHVYNWSEYLPDEVIKKFEEKYGVKVTYDKYSSNEEMYAKLKAGGSGYDLIFPSGYMVSALKREGLLAPINKANIPNLKNLDPNVKDALNDPNYEYSVPYMWGMTGIAINTEKVKTPVTSFADLWKPEFKNSLVMVDDAREIVGMTMRTLGYSMNDVDPKKLEEAKAKLKELQPNIKAYNSDTTADMMLSGEVVGGVVYSGAMARAMRQNPKITWIFPKEGVTLWMDNMAIPKDSPRKETAEAFINFILEPEISKMLSEAYPYSNPNAEANKLLPKEYQENPAITPPAEQVKKGEWIKDLSDEGAQAYDKIFTEVKG